MAVLSNPARTIISSRVVMVVYQFSFFIAGRRELCTGRRISHVVRATIQEQNRFLEIFLTQTLDQHARAAVGHGGAQDGIEAMPISARGRVEPTVKLYR